MRVDIGIQVITPRGFVGRVERRDLDQEFFREKVLEQDAGSSGFWRQGEVQGDLAVSERPESLAVGSHLGERPFTHRDEAVAQGGVRGVQRELKLEMPTGIALLLDLQQPPKKRPQEAGATVEIEGIKPGAW